MAGSESVTSNPTDPQRFGSRYVLGERLGRGAMGVVHLAEATHLDRPVAIKLLRPDLADDPNVVTRFVRERNLFRQIEHPNVVKVHEFVVEGDQLGIVMDHIEGGDLRQHHASQPLPPRQVVAVAAQIAAGLGAIHEAGVVHRDLKPANILLDISGGALTPKISDFGISRLVGASGTRSSMVVGTPLYMAPESIEVGRAGPAADVYALGAMLFELLAGRPPFESDHVLALVQMHAREAPPRLMGCPPGLSDLVDRMLAKDPADRPTALAAIDALRSIEPDLANVEGPFPTQVSVPPSDGSDESEAEASSHWPTAAVPPPPDGTPPLGRVGVSSPPVDWSAGPPPRFPSDAGLPTSPTSPRWSIGSRSVATVLAVAAGLAIAAVAFLALRPNAGDELASEIDDAATTVDGGPSPQANVDRGASDTSRVDGPSSATGDSSGQPAGPSAAEVGDADDVASADDAAASTDGFGTSEPGPTTVDPTTSLPSDRSTASISSTASTTRSSTTVSTVTPSTATSRTVTTAAAVVNPRISLAPGPFLCDGAYHPIGTITGMTPNGQVRYTSTTPDPPTYTDTADANGQLQPTWRCTDTTPRTITRTATDTTTGRTVTYNYTTEPA